MSHDTPTPGPGGDFGDGREHVDQIDQLDNVDAMILDLLRETQRRLDPVPAHLVDEIKFALTVRALDAEIAELTSMSLTATRSEPAMADTVTFSAGAMSLMITVMPADNDLVRVDAWVTTPHTRVELTIDGQVFDGLADEFGRLAFEAVPHGRASFIMWPDPAGSGPSPVVTPAITI